ncbi:MAG: helix-turn-helix domain-containing protein [Gammaproteobacteria bacterium]
MQNLTVDPFATVLDKPVKSNRQIGVAWERFVATGEFGRNSPRQTIAESWRRCRDLGIRPEANRAPTQLDLQSIEHLLSTAALGVSAVEVIRSYEYFLHATGHVIVLADASGNILHVAGQQGTRQQLERINFMPGGMWAEEICGPNGVGTPLKLGRAEVVLGTEHFCQGWQPWVCYGAPVRDPESGEPIGVIDITGPVRMAQLETLSLTVAIAQAVEQRLQLRELRRREDLHGQYLEILRRWPNDAIILLSRGGRVLDANAAGLEVLCVHGEATRNQRLVDAAPEIARELRGMRLNDPGAPVVIERDLSSWESGARMRLESMRDRTGLLAGYLLFIHRAQHAFVRNTVHSDGGAGTATISLRANEDDLIRRTLEECDGEISRAARQLGIARSTLYRRLKKRH